MPLTSNHIFVCQAETDRERRSEFCYKAAGPLESLFGSFAFMAIRQRRGGRGVLRRLSAWSA